MRDMKLISNDGQGYGTLTFSVPISFEPPKGEKP